jgi:hypothetical protein
MNSIANGNPNGKPADPQVEQLIAALRRLERRFDEFAAAYLNAKFPYGRPVDRWRRRS